MVKGHRSAAGALSALSFVLSLVLLGVALAGAASIFLLLSLGALVAAMYFLVHCKMER